MAFLVKCIGHLLRSRATDKGNCVRTSTSSWDDGNAPRLSGDTTASTNIRNRSYKPEERFCIFVELCGEVAAMPQSVPSQGSTSLFTHLVVVVDHGTTALP